jgi:hypothetical protein
LAKGFRIEPFNADYVRDVVKGIDYFRPRLPVRLQNNSKSFRTALLVDSGADISMIPIEIAETLELELGEEKTNIGPNGKFYARKSNVELWLYAGKKETYIGKIPLIIPTNRQEDAGDLPLLCVMGRNPLFEMYDITFQESKRKVHFEPSKKPAPPPPPPPKD